MRINRDLKRMLFKKNIWINIFFLISYHIQGQEISTFKLSPPDSNESKDLYFLEKELDNKKLILLGEMTHMYGDIFEMKARIVEYLHKNLGFNTIAIESSMYDLWKMHKQTSKFSPKLFNENIWGVWSQTQEFQRLVNYVKNNNIKVIGFDSQVNNSNSFIEDFFEFCKRNKINVSLDQDEFAILMESILDAATFDDYHIKFKEFESQITEIIDKIGELNSTDEIFYWYQFCKSLLACGRDTYYNSKPIYSSYFADQEDNFRDEQMADNLLAYINRYPKEKIICWADNIHVINDMSSIKAPIIKDFIPMGSYIKKKLGNKVYSLATIHANDSLYEKNIWHPTPIQPNSFESKLKSQNSPYLFVSSNQKEMRKKIKHRLLNFVDFIEGRLDQLHDGYIFLEHAKLPKNELLFTTANKEKELKQKKEESIKFKKWKIKIIDSETNLPIPYASIILKKEEIYRVSDEEGYFEFTIDESNLETKVNISSLGYKDFCKKLNSLDSIISLKPSLEKLDEVIITSYGSPKTILKKVIQKLNENYPIDDFNYDRYSHVIINRNDENLLDLELVTKEYDEGYDQLNIPTQRVEQIKWNLNSSKNTYTHSSQFFHFRQNAIQYANILHKRKYKKFDLEFVKSNKMEDEGLYVIKFKTERDKWSFTNHAYPTSYSGRVYINKQDYAVVKIVQNWETTLNSSEIEEFKFWLGANLKDKKEVKIKEENTCVYSKNENQKYYAKKYFFKLYTDKIDFNSRLENTVFESSSIIFNIKTTGEIEEIPYEHKRKKETRLDRVSYNKNFWDLYYKNNIYNYK